MKTRRALPTVLSIGLAACVTYANPNPRPAPEASVLHARFDSTGTTAVRMSGQPPVTTACSSTGKFETMLIAQLTR